MSEPKLTDWQLKLAEYVNEHGALPPLRLGRDAYGDKARFFTLLALIKGENK